MSSYRDKLLSIGFVRSSQAVREYRRDDGVRVKEIEDDAGNITRHHNTGDTERVDVQIRPSTVIMQANQESEK
jgi:hypothetical protein